jgi:hypothetical protein
MKRYWDFIIITAMAIVIAILLFKCDGGCPEGTTTSDTIIIAGDPYPVISYQDKPVPYEVLVPGDTFWPDVDTSVILQKCKLLYKDYYTKNIYADTLKDDTSALIVLLDTVYMNQLQKRSMAFQNRRSTSIITTTTIIGEIPVNKLYFGAGIDGELNPFYRDPTISLNALLVMKKRWAYEVEFGFPIKNVENVRFSVKAFYKLSFKKN